MTTATRSLSKHSQSLVDWLSAELTKKWQREAAPEPPTSAGQMNDLDRVRGSCSPLGGTAVKKR